LLLNLLSDFPMITIATDTVDVQELRRPKSYQVREIVLFATILGLVSTVFDFIFFAVFSRISPEALQTNWFIGSVLTELIVIYSIRTRFVFWRGRRPSTSMIWLTTVAGLATVLLPISSIGQRVFHFTPPTGGQVLMIAVIVLAYLFVTESVKHVYYRFIQRPKPSLAVE
jgi:Mg2+-importing ATPase